MTTNCIGVFGTNVSHESKEEKIGRIKGRMKGIVSEEGMKKGLTFQPRSSDIVVVGHPKSGTTWLQQIVHQLRTGGDEDFKDISLVVPLLESAADIGQDLEAEQKAFPRCFKVCYWSSPRNFGKYIVILRHPYSVAYSSYLYDKNCDIFKSEELSVEEYVLHCWIPPRFNFVGKSYLDFITGWWEHRREPNVMFVFYEDLIENSERELRRIAKFMDIDSESNIRVSVERSSFGYMKNNWEKFNSNVLKAARSRLGGVEEAAGMSRAKVRTGTTTEGKEKLPLQVCQLIDSKWKEIVEPVTGFSTYEDLCKGLKQAIDRAY
jgi:hypothetical protein